TAIPETGTEIVFELPAFTWTSGGAPAECEQDGDDDATPPPGDGDDQGDDAAGDDQGDDGATGDDGSATVTPVGDGTASGDSRSDLARTGVSAGSMIAAAGLLSLAGAGALGLRHRMTRP
ncbi:MAG TPA: LPXTG cell wall anchor domain-containing protein, partial [Brachybacterium massiliense]|nr:LPXTG cell wall anchor domain-containing protein [Brachybacterium massiliense]